MLDGSRTVRARRPERAASASLRRAPPRRSCEIASRANSTSQANPLYPPPNFCHCGRAVRLPSDNPVSATDMVSCDVGRALPMSIPGEALALQRGAQFRLRHPYRNGGLDPLVECTREFFGRGTSVNEAAYKRRVGVDIPRPQCSGRGRCGNYHRHGNRYTQEPFSRCTAWHSCASTTAAASTSHGFRPCSLHISGPRTHPLDLQVEHAGGVEAEDVALG